MVISKSLFQTIRQRAQFRCEYCHYPELLNSAPLSVDHLPSKDDPKEMIDYASISGNC
jgi:hypothetical protein